MIIATKLRLAALATLGVALLAAACGDDTGPNSGDLRATAATTGVDLDADGYVVVIDDGAQSTAIDVNESATFFGLSTGSHTVEITSVAANCDVAGDNPRTVSVGSGGTAATTFVVTCSSLTGNATVTTSTTGDELDDGYLLTVDGGAGQSIGVNAMIVISDLTSGDHLFELTDVAANCAVSGENPRTLQVPAGGQVATTFAVSCSSTTGDLDVTTSTTGTDLDPDGYTLSVDGGATQSIGANALLSITGLAEGDHSVDLGDVAANCSVAGNNPRTVSVTAGGTAATTFEVTCAEQVGTLEVSTVTWGLNTDNSYNVTIDGGSGRAISGNDTETISAVPTGDRQIELAGIQGNCTVEGGANPRAVTVLEGQTTQTTFEVFCFQALSNRIAYESRGTGDSEILIMTTTGSGRTNMTRNPAFDREPSVAPDGSSVVFESDRSGNRDIWLMDFDGFRNLTSSSSDERSPNFRGDGSQVVYTRRANGVWSLWRVAVSGGSANRVTDDAADDEQPAWSPDGSKILFRSNRAGGGNFDIWLVDSDGTNFTRLTTDAAEDGKPAWSSDGTQISWSSNRDGSFDVWRADFDAGARTISNLENLTPHAQWPLTDGKSDWRPGADEVAFSSGADGSDAIWTMDLSGGSISYTQLTNGADDDVEPSWSP